MTEIYDEIKQKFLFGNGDAQKLGVLTAKNYVYKIISLGFFLLLHEIFK